MQSASGLRLIQTARKRTKAESCKSWKHMPTLLRATWSRVVSSVWLGRCYASGCPRCYDTEPNSQDSSIGSHTRPVAPIPSRTKRQNARGMIGATVCMLHKPMVCANIPAFARITAFVLLLSLMYASKYCPKYHVSVYLLLAADYYVDTYLGCCNITRIFAFPGIRLPNDLIPHTQPQRWRTGSNRSKRR